MWLSNDVKIRDTVQALGLKGGTPTATPLPTEYQAFYPHELGDEDLAPDPETGYPYSPLLDRAGHSRFRQLVGSLQYFAQALRPDVGFAANALAQVAHRPRERHWKAALHCLRYLAGTPDLALYFSAEQGLSLVGYTDSDFAGCIGSRKSTTGWLFRLAGSPVCWKSKKQSVITLSSTEAEYRALTSATQEVMWLRQLLVELGVLVSHATPLYCDNESAIRISRDPVHRSRTRHVALSFLFVRQEQRAGTIRVTPIRSNRQVADYLTKPCDASTFQTCRTLAGQTLAPSGSKEE